MAVADGEELRLGHGAAHVVQEAALRIHALADDRVRSLIHERAAEAQLIHTAQSGGMRSMREDGERLVAEGTLKAEDAQALVDAGTVVANGSDAPIEAAASRATSGVPSSERLSTSTTCCTASSIGPSRHTHPDQ